MTPSTPVSEFVTDTMGLVLRIEKRKLGKTGKTIFESVEAENSIVHIPALVFAEILYLSEKQRISTSLQTVNNFLQQHPNYKDCPLSFEIIQAASQITDVPELHDRLIAPTTRHFGVKLITNDPAIQASLFVNTVW